MKNRTGQRLADAMLGQMLIERGRMALEMSKIIDNLGKRRKERPDARPKVAHRKKRRD